MVAGGVAVMVAGLKSMRGVIQHANGSQASKQLENH